MPAVERRKPVWNEVQGGQSAGAHRQMRGDAEVPDRSQRHLADPVCGSVFVYVQQLAVLRDFAAPEYGPGTMFHGSLRDERIVAKRLAMVVDRLAAPRQRSGQLPA